MNNQQQNDLPQLPFTTSHAFIIGIDKYRDNRISRLKTAVSDAEKIAEVLQQEQDFTVQAQLLDATREEIEKLLKETLPEIICKRDRVFFYYAGHGVAVEGKDGRPNGYLVPADADAKNIAQTSVPMSLLYETLNTLECKHGLLVLDCCFSGAFRWSSGYRDLMNFGPETLCQEHFDRFVRDPSWKVITSAAYDQKALDVLDGLPTGERGIADSGKHSPFAQYLFEGLAGKADVLEDGREGDGVITAPELYEHICKRLVPASMELGEKQRQTPDFFPLSDKDRQGQFIFLNRNNRKHLPSIPLRNPYKGLQSFDMADSNLFFGRDRVIANLRAKAAKCKLLVVAGASGTGKSSVIKAGLLPVLRDEGWRILPVVRPGADPVAALEEAFKSLPTPPPFRQAPRISRDRQDRLPRREFEEGVPTGFIKELCEQKTVLLIDQYEELITQSGRSKRQQFAGILQQLLSASSDNRLKIIITVRADYIEPAHDALVRVWMTLHDWIDSIGKERLLLFDKVRTATIDARQTGKLWDNDPRLESLKTELDSKDSLLNLQETDFIKRSVERKQKRARNRRILTMTIMAALSALTVWALLNAQRANREASRLRADILAIAAKEVLATDNTKALRLAEAAYRIVKDDPLPAVQNILSEAFHTLREKKAFYSARFAHADEVTAAVFSPDGKMILTASRDGTAKLWDKDGNESSAFSHDSVPIKLAAFSPNSKRILTGAENGAVKLWDMAGVPIDSLTHQKNIYSAVFSADGKYILTACADDTARLWNLQDKSIARMAHDDEVFSAVFSPDSSKILTASADRTARIWDLSGNPVDTLAGHQKQVNSAIFSADGKLVLTAARDGMARLWDAQGNLRATLDHAVAQDNFFRAIFSQDGRRILTASADSTAILWDIAGNPLDTLNHSGMIYTAHFSRDGRNILTASADSTARLWDAHGNLLAIFTHNNSVTNAVFSPDGLMALTASKDGTAKLWNRQNTGTRDFDKCGHIAAFSPKGERILTVSDDHFAKFRDVQNGSADSLKLGARTEHAVFSPDNKHLFTASEDGVARLWNWRQKRLVDSLAHPEFKITAARFSPDGEQLLAIGDDDRARLWRVAEKFINRTTPAVFAPGIEITSANFSPDGQKIITASPDGYARIWRQDGTLLDSLNHDGDEVVSAFFSSATGYVLTAVTEGTVRLWDGRGRVTGSLLVDEIDSAVLSHNGRHVLIILSDGPATVWHTQSQKIDRLSHPVKAVFSPDDRQILAAYSDGVARLWNLNGDLLAKFGKPSIDELVSAEFSPDGKRILTRSIDDHVRLWRTPRAIFDWLKQAGVYRLSGAEKARYKLK